MKKYIIKLDKRIVGSTQLEFSDPPMGVVFGKIIFNNIKNPFEYLKDFCLNNNCKINDLDEKEEFIDTQVIDSLKVFNDKGSEVKGCGGNYITGMTSEGFEITILGIPGDIFQQEFPIHLKKYEKK